MRNNRCISAALALALGIASVPHPAPAATPEVKVKLFTQAGAIVVVLDPKRAPQTVANFLRYVDARFYNGGTFFRAIPGFVIQGGNKPRETPADPKLALEPPLATGIRNTDGAISMARTSDPNSATSEFFICDGPQARLDVPPGYAAFGHVVSGMDVVRRIARMPVDGDQLEKPVVIYKIVRER
jgi:peptidyl-prolyl cis-trans isomerase A (cyclophilin A)